MQSLLDPIELVLHRSPLASIADPLQRCGGKVREGRLPSAAGSSIGAQLQIEAEHGRARHGN
jgi:hypothetical protein